MMTDPNPATLTAAILALDARIAALEHILQMMSTVLDAQHEQSRLLVGAMVELLERTRGGPVH
jgi:hypothetical protein